MNKVDKKKFKVETQLFSILDVLDFNLNWGGVIDLTR